LELSLDCILPETVDGVVLDRLPLEVVDHVFAGSAGLYDEQGGWMETGE
jgi:hypothetical protein